MKQNQEDKIISEFLKSLGPWRDFVVIGGGFALFIYKLYLADPKLENPPVGTRDIDSLIPRRIPEISKKTSPNTSMKQVLLMFSKMSMFLQRKAM
jgi:hypothetical protein